MKIAKIFKNVKKSGNIIYIPIKDTWASLFDSLDKFSDDFMTERKQPKVQTITQKSSGK
ncbi:MAG: hypothetical protein QMD07_06255 [Thermodesulfovibrionales bacterium]|nr:hypothetical protein [Thermodesulfovibrionales bacterium]